MLFPHSTEKFLLRLNHFREQDYLTLKKTLWQDPFYERKILSASFQRSLIQNTSILNLKQMLSLILLEQRRIGGYQNFGEGQVAFFVDKRLERFGEHLYYSRLLSEIDNLDDSIVGNETSIKMQKWLEPILGFRWLYYKLL